MKIALKKRKQLKTVDINNENIQTLDFEKRKIFFVPDEWQVYIQREVPKGYEHKIYQTNRVPEVERLKEEFLRNRLKEMRNKK